MIRLLTVVGARPQFVKAAALSRVLANDANFQEVLVHTGQHFDENMSEVFFDEMEIPRPDYHMEINRLGHGAMTGRMLEEIEKVLLKEQPNCVLVYGDTNSTLAGALAARKLQIPVAHVEAGLRSFNMEMPEEVNRILTDRISSFLFCPTEAAMTNLKSEGYDNFDIEVSNVGDVMQDAALFYASRSSERSDVLADIPHDRFAVTTIHRQENTDDRETLARIVEGLNTIHRDVIPVVFPIHPRTKKMLADHGLALDVHQLDPVGYFDMIELLKKADLVLTDSGGLQKEAYFFGNACVTIREQTEWVELVEGGFNELVGSDTDKMVAAASRMLNEELDFSGDLYGGGKACDNIKAALAAAF